MVELRTKEREMRQDGGNHDEKLGLGRISCAMWFTITNKADIVFVIGPGNPPAVQVWTAKTGQFGYRPAQIPDLLTIDCTHRFQSPVLRLGFHIYGRIQICYCLL